MALLGLLASGLTAHADVKPHRVFTDHMVLQRDIKSADYPLLRFRGGWGCWSGPLMEDLVEKPWYRVAIDEDLARLKPWKRIVPDVKAIDDCPGVGFYFARKVQQEPAFPSAFWVPRTCEPAFNHPNTCAAFRAGRCGP